MSRSILNLIGKLELVNKTNNRRIIAGYGNIAVVDSQSQFIPLETLKAGLNTLLGDLSYANLMLSHNNVQIGKILKNYGKLTTHVDDKGLFIIAELRNDIATADETWDKILKGEINGFSIGCEVLSEPREVCDANGCITYLDKINILEVSICSRPVNEMSGFTVISKSDAMSNDVCKDCYILDDKMTEKKKVETKEEQPIEEKEEPKELSVEERLEAMERSIFNMQATITKLSESIVKEEEPKPVEEKPTELPPEPIPVKSEEVPKEEEEPGLTKKDFDEFKNAILDLLTPKEEEVKVKSELELALKARDEVIENMKKQLGIQEEKEKIKEIESAEQTAEPQTIQEEPKPEEPQFDLEEDFPIVIKNGEVTARKFV